MDLAQLVPGDRARIVSMTTKGALKRRLLDMGLLPGEEVVVHKVAPLGDPIEIAIKCYRLSLRKSEAAEIVVEVAP